MLTLEIDITEIEKNLSSLEKSLDFVLVENRRIVRLCSNSIKAMHSKNLFEAKKNLSEAKELLEPLKKFYPDFSNHIDHIYQEYSEAIVVLSAIESKSIPSLKSLDIPQIPYLLGLLDSVGELKREMYEELRIGRKKEATEYFKLMELIFDSLLPLRFSNAILPDFRRKQDVARSQIEQARGELI